MELQIEKLFSFNFLPCLNFELWTSEIVSHGATYELSCSWFTV